MLCMYMQEVTTITTSPRDSYFTSNIATNGLKTPRRLLPENFGQKNELTFT
jgi:hypothetical protein